MHQMTPFEQDVQKRRFSYAQLDFSALSELLPVVVSRGVIVVGFWLWFWFCRDHCRDVVVLALPKRRDDKSTGIAQVLSQTPQLHLSTSPLHLPIWAGT